MIPQVKCLERCAVTYRSSWICFFIYACIYLFAVLVCRAGQTFCNFIYQYDYNNNIFVVVD